MEEEEESGELRAAIQREPRRRTASQAKPVEVGGLMLLLRQLEAFADKLHACELAEWTSDKARQRPEECRGMRDG